MTRTTCQPAMVMSSPGAMLLLVHRNAASRTGSFVFRGCTNRNEQLDVNAARTAGRCAKIARRASFVVPRVSAVRSREREHVAFPELRHQRLDVALHDVA